ncbi:LysR family transcriptional regulator [Hyphomonas pacifica]|uniref:LysR family transcriptional regulator n=1 Tax=Hyphomonas pacifica TaxID=1280941 RepID=UPI000DBF6C60|nr:LysR family transcriptional regulator [Hyphomonas pacifica]RAN35905.1 hypothetical protein HY11_13055 [Hyphomonas pacifica]
MAKDRIDWDKLRVFVVVAELGSMTAAAARLKESTPTVSRKIDELEKSLDSQLFQRSTRGMELTEAGKTTLRYARQMEEAASHVLSKASGHQDKIQGRVTIGSGDGIGPLWIGRQLREFRDKHPRIQVRMRVQDHNLDLLNDEADVVIRFTEPREPEIISHKLGTAHYMAFAAQSYLDMQESLPSSIFEYHHHRCILHEAYAHQIERWAPKAVELTKMIDFAVITNSATAMIELCRQGGGIAMLPSYIAEIYPDLVPLDISEVAPIQFWISYTEDARRNPAAVAAIEWIRGLFDYRVTPWFRDGFIHPKEVMPSREGQQVGDVQEDISRIA